MLKPRDLIFFGIITLSLAIGASIWVRNHFPVTIEQPKPIPHIITKTDTLEVEPKWVRDSLKKLAKKVVTTDTVEIYRTYTVIKPVHDTIIPAVDSGLILPVVSLLSGTKFGDTGFVETINVKTKEKQVASFFVSGTITSLTAGEGKPRINFEPFRVDTLIKKKSSLLSLILAGSVGYSACRIQTLITGK